MRKGFFWQLANGLSIAAINLLFVMIMARFIPKEIHGTYAILFVINNFFFMFSQFGMGAALVQKKDLEKHDISKAFFLNLLISIFIYALLFLGAGLISGFFDGKVAAGDIRILGVTLLFTSISAISVSLLQRDFRFKQIFIINLVAYGIAYIGIGAYMAVNDYGLDAFIYAQLALQLLLSVVAFVIHPFRIRRVPLSVSDNRFFINFGKDFTIIRLLSLSAGKIDKFILGKTVVLEALANFEKAQYLTFLPPRFLNNLTNGFMFSLFARFQSEHEKLFRTYASVTSLLMVVVLHISFVMYSLSLLIIDLFYGDNWLDIDLFVKGFVVAAPFLALAGISDALIRAKNDFRASKIIKVIYLVVLALVTLSSLRIDLIYVILLQVLVTIVYGVFMNGISLRIVGKKEGVYLPYLKLFILSGILFAGYHFILPFLGMNVGNLWFVILFELATVGLMLLFRKWLFTNAQMEILLKLMGREV